MTMHPKPVEYDFKSAYGLLNPEVIGMLQLKHVNMMILMSKMHMVRYPAELHMFFEALKYAMGSLHKDPLDFFSKFDYKTDVVNRKVLGKQFDFNMEFVFSSIIGYNVSVDVAFDFSGVFFIVGKSETNMWTDI